MIAYTQARVDAQKHSSSPASRSGQVPGLCRKKRAELELCSVSLYNVKAEDISVSPLYVSVLAIAAYHVRTRAVFFW